MFLDTWWGRLVTIYLWLNSRNKETHKFDQFSVLWDIFWPCERRQECGSSLLHWIGPFSTVWTPDITPLACKDINSQLCQITFLMFFINLKINRSHLFCGYVVHCLLVTSSTKGTERKVTRCHMVKGHLEWDEIHMNNIHCLRAIHVMLLLSK